MGKYPAVIFGAMEILGWAAATVAAPASAVRSPDSNVETNLESNETCASDFKLAASNYRGRPSTFSDDLREESLTPLVWKNFRGPRVLAGYSPSFSPNRVSFARNGRPIIRDRDLKLQVLLDDGRWKKIDLIPVVTESLLRQGVIRDSSEWKPKYVPGRLFDAGPETEERVVFDASCAAYTILNANYSSLGASFLLYSADGGHSWSANKIPMTQNPLYTASLEVPTNPNVLRSPPAILVAEKYDPTGSGGPHAADGHRAWLTFPVSALPRKIAFAGPFLISDQTLCCGTHSGFEAQAVSSDGKIFVSFPGDRPARDPVTGRRGTPQYVRTFSRTRLQFVGESVLLGVGLLGPAGQVRNESDVVADSHSQASIAVDSRGFLHAVVAGHGSEMVYRRSTFPNVAEAWGSPEVFTLRPNPAKVNDYSDEYTYASLIIDRRDQPNVLARWSGKNYTFRLIYTRKDSNSGSWTPQVVLLDPGRAFYGIWYQKMSVDSSGRLFINYSYYPDNLFADEAESLGSMLGRKLEVQASYPPCVASNSWDPRLHYCHYIGYEALESGILSAVEADGQFRLTTTRGFFNF